MKEIEVKKIQLDQYGRIIIDDNNILESIAGAIQEMEPLVGDNVNCGGSNSGCSNTSCG